MRNIIYSLFAICIFSIQSMAYDTHLVCHQRVFTQKYESDDASWYNYEGKIEYYYNSESKTDNVRVYAIERPQYGIHNLWIQDYELSVKKIKKENNIVSYAPKTNNNRYNLKFKINLNDRSITGKIRESGKDYKFRLLCLDQLHSRQLQKKYMKMNFKNIPAKGNEMPSVDTENRKIFENDFQITESHITQAQFAAVMGYNPSKFNNKENCPSTYTTLYGALIYSVGICPNNPVDSVSKHGINEFLRKLSNDKCNYTLPTEQEWEFSARGGTTTDFYWDDVANSHLNSWNKSNSLGHPHPVCEKRRNPFGLCDMAGNIKQVTSSVYSTIPENIVHGDHSLRNYSNERIYQGNIDRHEYCEKTPAYNKYVLRGGGYDDDILSLKTSSRQASINEDLNEGVGFRIVRTCKQ